MAILASLEFSIQKQKANKQEVTVSRDYFAPENRVLLEKFKEHLASEYSSENIKFLEALRQAKIELEGKSAFEIHTRFKEIYNEYIKPGSAPNQVNISSAQVDIINHALNTGFTLTSLDDAETEIIGLLKKDTFARFAKKENYSAIEMRSAQQGVTDAQDNLKKAEQQKNPAAITQAKKDLENAKTNLKETQATQEAEKKAKQRAEAEENKIKAAEKDVAEKFAKLEKAQEKVRNTPNDFMAKKQAYAAELDFNRANKHFANLTQSKAIAEEQTKKQKSVKAKEDRVLKIRSEVKPEALQSQIEIYKKDYGEAKDKVANFVPVVLKGLNSLPQDEPSTQLEQMALKSFIKDTFIKDMRPNDENSKKAKILAAPIHDAIKKLENELNKVPYNPHQVALHVDTVVAARKAADDHLEMEMEGNMAALQKAHEDLKVAKASGSTQEIERAEVKHGAALRRMDSSTLLFSEFKGSTTRGSVAEKAPNTNVEPESPKSPKSPRPQ